MARFRVSMLLLAGLLTGCAAGPRAEPAARGGGRVINEAELRSRQENSLYEVIDVLRPAWLRERPTTDLTGEGRPTPAQVFVDGNHRGDVEFLRQIPASDVASVRYLNVAEAASTFTNLMTSTPVIAVTIRRGP